MKFGNFSRAIAALGVVMTLSLSSASQLAAQEASQATAATMRRVTILGLTTNNTLVPFGSPLAIRVTGIDGNLEGIDFRPAVDPAKRLLYGLTDTNKIYTIDYRTGKAQLVCTLSPGFDGGFQSGFDFNPQLDRLRLVGSNRRNFSVNLDAVDANGNCTATPQTLLAYINGDANSGIDPNISGVAYTNNIPQAPSTVLYDLDYNLDVLSIQNPPPSGQLATQGSVGINLAAIAGFDIVTDNGQDFPFAISGSTLLAIDLKSGKATPVGSFLRGGGGFVGLAIVPNQSR
jgi:hypothetical protein